MIGVPTRSRKPPQRWSQPSASGMACALARSRSVGMCVAGFHLRRPLLPSTRGRSRHRVDQANVRAHVRASPTHV
jgi:hypothetical protein